MVLFLIALNVTLIVVVFVVRRPVEKRSERTAHSTAVLLSQALGPDEPVSADAAAVIARYPLEHAAALTGMIAMVKTAPPRARLAGLWAVRSLLRARPECCSVCWRDPDPQVRAAVVASVERDGRPAAPERLAPADIVENASGDADPIVRRAAYAALHVLGRERARPVVWRGLDDEDPEVVRLAAGRLGDIVDVATLPRVVEYLATARRENVRSVLQAVARMDGSIVEPLIQLALTAPRLKTRVAALRAIGVASVPSACLGLVPLLHDPRSELRRAAAAAVADIARIAAGHGIHADVVDHLGTQLQQERESRVLLVLLDAIESCRAAGALAVIRRKLPDVGPAVRERGLEAIAAIEGHESGAGTAAGRMS
jgi:HEAT repeat protein